MATTRVTYSGPIFDGRAEAEAEKLCAGLAREVAEVGATWIKLDTQRMDKSGRGGTGQASDGVELIGAGLNYVIRGGIREGQYSWPWLEGTSRRNLSTSFKGYHSFRRTRLRMRKSLTQARLDELAAPYVAEMGGGA
jgi:hypothetical protein